MSTEAANERWDRYRHAITDLYHEHKLQDVQRIMLTEYGFRSSLRMYKRRLKEWGIRKNSSSVLNRELLDELGKYASKTTSRTALLGPSLNAKKYRSMTRYARATGQTRQLRQWLRQHEVQRRLSTDDGSEDQYASTESPSVSPSVHYFNEYRSNADVSTSPESGISREEATPSTLTDTSLVVTPESNDADEDFVLINLSPGRLLSPTIRGQTDVARLTSNIQQYYSTQLDYGAESITAADLLDLGATRASKKFWANLKNGIYLLKISGSFPDPLNRAFTALDDAFVNAEFALNCQPLDFLRELMVTLSPVNTQLFPEVRYRLLKDLRDMATQYLKPTHPIAIICSQLLLDHGRNDVTNAGLQCMLDCVGQRFGSANAASYRIQDTFVTLARRGRNLDVAERKAVTLLKASKTNFGPNSREARKAARSLSHVLIDQGHLDRAMYFSKTSLFRTGSATTVLHSNRCHVDDLAVDSMEDIAYLCDKRGDLHSAYCWLQKAKYTAGHVEEESVATLHIQDKIDDLENRTGLAFWVGV